jgi:hypothetical protein
MAYAPRKSVQIIHLATTSVGETDIKQRIITLLQEDEIFNLVREILLQDPSENKYEEYNLTSNELFIYNNRLYVTNSTSLKHLIMDDFNWRPYMVHPSYHKMITTIR